ncbi:MAG TPA: 3-deoxy-7-phosphoheptulonate synthase [Solirubrobacteraceae bacterium]
MPLGSIKISDEVRDQRIDQVIPLRAPTRVLSELPLASESAEVVRRGRGEIARILNREDDRVLAVVGPCSVHDPDGALEYATRLSASARELQSELCIAMRVYFEKPRTTTGWKGFINDPHLDGSADVNAGLALARKLMLEVVDLGLPVACEFLDPITPQYIADAVAWGAIGARTTESQIHRQLASGLSMPVGFKNRTDGNIQVAVDAVRAAAVPHAFAGIDLDGTPAVLHTRGNTDCHIILRGGRGAPNYDAESVRGALDSLRAAGLPERVVIDASHDNSGKDPARQAAVIAGVSEQVAGGDRAIVGVMLESFLLAGRQDLGDGQPLTYGQSITDACMSWEQTLTVLAELVDAVRARRAAG